jgi:hypothetical protein
VVFHGATEEKLRLAGEVKFHCLTLGWNFFSSVKKGCRKVAMSLEAAGAGSNVVSTVLARALFLHRMAGVKQDDVAHPGASF